MQLVCLEILLTRYCNVPYLQILVMDEMYAGSTGLAEKQRDMSRLGMEGLLDDVALQRHRLMQQYLDAEGHSQHHLQQVAEVCSKVEAVVEQASAAAAHPGPCWQYAHSR